MHTIPFPSVFLPWGGCGFFLVGFVGGFGCLVGGGGGGMFNFQKIVEVHLSPPY